ERPGVARAAGAEQALDDADGVGGGHADRLVQDEPAVHIALVAPELLLPRAALASVTSFRGSDGKWAGPWRLPLPPLTIDLPLKRGGEGIGRAGVVTHCRSHSSRPARSRRTRGDCNSLSIRSASSKRSSMRKRTSG